MLTPFDYAVIEYAQVNGLTSEFVYRQVEKKNQQVVTRGHSGRYRSGLTEDELMYLLNLVKADPIPSKPS